MRVWAFWFVFAVVGTAVALLALGAIDDPSSLPVSILPVHGESMSLPVNNRKLKVWNHVMSTTNIERNLVSIDIEDYPHFDPVPNSKAAIKAGPIEHGTPLMPYVPKPEPPAPSHPGYGGPP